MASNSPGATRPVPKKGTPRVCLARHKAFRPPAISDRSGFDVPTSLVGVSTWKGTDGKGVTVYYASGGASNLHALAADIVTNRIDAIMQFCDRLFAVRGASGNVIIRNGSSGAYHYGCDFTNGGDWYEDDFNTDPPPATSAGGLVAGLVMAEVCESYMGLQGKGWNCGGSGGEALSRVLGEIASGGIAGAMSGGFSARSSYDGSDWISRDQGSDQDYPSIGCGMLYLDWLQSLGHSIDEIVQAGEPDGTLASNYAKLTARSKTTAWMEFQAAVAKVDITRTNPFGIVDTPFPDGGTPPPPPPPPPGASFGTVDSPLPIGVGSYAVHDAAGSTVGQLAVLTAGGPGSFPVTAGGAGPAVLHVSAEMSPGAYDVQSLGTLNVTADLPAGSQYEVSATPSAAPIRSKVLMTLLAVIGRLGTPVHLPDVTGPLGELCGLPQQDALAIAGLAVLVLGKHAEALDALCQGG